MYINREATKQKLNDLHFQNYGVAVLAIMEMPSVDVVEVVRCKDCLKNEMGNCYHSKNYPMNNTYRPDFYCADGLRVRRCRE